MNTFSALSANISAAVSIFGALIALGTFVYKDVVERRRRKQLALATLGYQIFLLQEQITSGNKGTSLLSPNVLHPFVDVFLESPSLVAALSAFGAVYRQLETMQPGLNTFTQEQKNAALDQMNTSAQSVSVAIGKRKALLKKTVKLN